MSRHLSVVRNQINGFRYEDIERLRYSATDQVDAFSSVLKQTTFSRPGKGLKHIFTNVYTAMGHMAVPLDLYVSAISPPTESDTESAVAAKTDAIDRAVTSGTPHAAVQQKAIISGQLQKLAAVLTNETPLDDARRAQTADTITQHHHTLGLHVIILGILSGVDELPQFMQRYQQAP